MRRLFTFISALTLMSLSAIYGQVSIAVSNPTGCESLESIAFLSPPAVYDTINSVSWSILQSDQNMEGDTVFFQLSSPGKYSIKALINGSTEILLPQNLEVFPVPVSEFSYDYNSSSPGYSYLFEMVEGDSSPAKSYEWQVNNETEGNAKELWYTFEETGNYTVQLTARDANGCESSSRQDIIVADALQCPNVFTPNLDGFNDFFKVSTDGVTIYSFQVFSKTGIEVFHSESPSILWDGRSLSGVEMQPGIYYYLIEAVKGTNNDKISGFVHLIR